MILKVYEWLLHNSLGSAQRAALNIKSRQCAPRETAVKNEISAPFTLFSGVRQRGVRRFRP